MPTVEQIVLDTQRLSDAAIQGLTSNLAEYEAIIWARIQEFLKRFDVSDGHFVPNEKVAELVMAVKKEMAGILDLKKLEESTKAFVASFDAIQKNAQALHGEQNGLVVPKSLVNREKAFAVDSTEYALREANIHPAFMLPVRKALYTHINSGASVRDTERILKALVVGPDGKNGVLTKWAGQVATDAINQYEGVVQTAIANEYQLFGTRYVNSIVTTSRAQCIRWVEMQWLPFEVLSEEIEWAKKNGSGMVLETTPTTFRIYRGGYRCRHKAIPVKNELAARMAAQRSAPPKPSAEEIAAAKAKAERGQALQELTSMRKQMDEFVQRAQTIAASVSGASKEVIEAAIATGKELEAEALALANLSDKWSKFHTSGATPDAELAGLINSIQWDGIERIPEILKGVPEEVKKQLAAKMKELAGQMGALKSAVNAAIVAANNSKTQKALKEAKMAVTNSIAGMKVKRDEMHALAKELNTTLAWETFNTADDYVDEAIVEGHPVYSILDPPKKPKPKPKEISMDVSTWKSIGGQKGSNPGGLYEAPDGSTWYVKEPATEDHVRNEALAAALYKAVGIAVADVRMATNGKKAVVASRIAEGSVDEVKTKAGLPSFLDGFAADAWLANWDVVGSKFENVIHGPNGAVRIDMGGSLRYRAMGTPKGDSFGAVVKEFDSLRNGSNPQAAEAFKNLVPKDVLQQAKKIRDFAQSGELDNLVKSLGPTDKVVANALLQKLKVRAVDLYAKAERWAENPIKGTAPDALAYDPLSLRFKAKEASELLAEMQPIAHDVLDLFQPKGVFAGLFSKAQAKKIENFVRNAEVQSKPFKYANEAEKKIPSVKSLRTKLEKLAPTAEKEIAAVKRYTQSSYQDMNKVLAARSDEQRKGKAEYVELSKQMASALDKITNDEAFVVYRGESDGDYAMHLYNLRKELVGKIVRRPSFTSTSVVPGRAFGGRVVFRIFVPKNTRGAYVDHISENQGELEYILQRGSYLAITGLEERPGGVTFDAIVVSQ